MWRRGIGCQREEEYEEKYEWSGGKKTQKQISLLANEHLVLRQKKEGRGNIKEGTGMWIWMGTQCRNVRICTDTHTGWSVYNEWQAFSDPSPLRHKRWGCLLPLHYWPGVWSGWEGCEGAWEGLVKISQGATLASCHSLTDPYIWQSCSVVGLLLTLKTKAFLINYIFFPYGFLNLHSFAQNSQWRKCTERIERKRNFHKHNATDFE